MASSIFAKLKFPTPALGLRYRDFNGREASLSITAIAVLILTHDLNPYGGGLVIGAVGHSSHCSAGMAFEVVSGVCVTALEGEIATRE